MPNVTNDNLPSSTIPVPPWRAVLHWIARYAAIEIAVLLALGIAAYFLGHHLFDGSVPTQGDVRSHVFKIEFLQSYLSQFSWPQWNPYWYHGIPEDQFYPPGFYFLGAILGFVFKSGVVAYKILLLLDMVLNGLLIFFFARRFLKFDSHLAIWCLVTYETSTPLLINFYYGEGPNLLGWSVSIGFLTFYLSRAVEGKTQGLANIILPGFFLGAALLIHPFPVIFVFLAAVLFHVVWLIHTRAWRNFVRSQLPYSLGVFLVGGLIGTYYWLPAFLTLHWSSPIYSFTKFQWPGGTIYLLALVFLALTVYILTRLKNMDGLKLDFIFVSFAVACILGFGATAYLPFGLGSLVQEFRFATIIIPFFSILLILYPLKYRTFSFNVFNLAMALPIGLFVTALVFGLNGREAFASGFKSIVHPGLGSLYHLVATQFGPNFPNFAINVFPYFTIMSYFALSLVRRDYEFKRGKPVYIMAGGACLLLMTTFIPYINTARGVNLGDLSKYINNYEQADYAQIMKAAQNGRMIVSMNKGDLTQGDAPVTFGWKWGVQTVNGPYNQGDPKFFKFTVHLEWEERWLGYEYTRENLMQESAAKYIFVRDSFGFFSNVNGLSATVSNKYGRLLVLNENVTHADKVTPVLLDVKDPRTVTEFFNLLLPQGYKLVLVDVHDVPADLIDKFDYVMVDSKMKTAGYPGKTAFILNDSFAVSVEQSAEAFTLNVPYLTYPNRVCYHGDVADGYLWIGWDAWVGAQITPDIQAMLYACSNLLAPYFNKLDYFPVNYQSTDNRIEVSASPGFTLIKDSYFPYWKADKGQIVSTSQGFMLAYTDSANLTLNYQKPGYYIFAAVCSLMMTIVVAVILLVTFFRKPTKIG